MPESLVQHPDNDCRKWFVMSAFRQEKKAEKLLTESGFRCFVPKHYVVRTIHGKKQRLLQPVVANLVFWYASWNEIMAFKPKHDFLQLQTQIIQNKRHVMVVPDVQMEQFIRFAEQIEEDICYYRPEEINLSDGQLVRIIGGPFDGAEGTLKKVPGKRQKKVVVQLAGLLAVAASVSDYEYIQIIKD